MLRHLRRRSQETSPRPTGLLHTKYMRSNFRLVSSCPPQRLDDHLHKLLHLEVPTLFLLSKCCFRSQDPWISHVVQGLQGMILPRDACTRVQRRSARSLFGAWMPLQYLVLSCHIFLAMHSAASHLFCSFLLFPASSSELLYLLVLPKTQCGTAISR